MFVYQNKIGNVNFKSKTMSCNNCKTEDKINHSEPLCYYSNMHLNVVQCPSCGLVYLFPRPDKSLGLQYFDDAYSNAAGFENISYYRDHNQILKRSSDRLEIIKQITPPNKKILDFGAGQGHFVKTALDNKWDCYGTELSIEARKSAKDNLQIELLETIDELAISDFGVIALWDVIEHLENPKEVIEKLSRHLHPNGYFVIETSNIDSIEYIASKKDWSYWHLDHLFYYSRKSLDYLFNTLGFVQAKYAKNGTSQKRSIGEIVKKYFSHLAPNKLLFAIKVKRLSMKYKNLDKNSLMTVVYKRPD